MGCFHGLLHRWAAFVVWWWNRPHTYGIRPRKLHISIAFVGGNSVNIRCKMEWQIFRFSHFHCFRELVCVGSGAYVCSTNCLCLYLASQLTTDFETILILIACASLHLLTSATFVEHTHAWLVVPMPGRICVCVSPSKNYLHMQMYLKMRREICDVCLGHDDKQHAGGTRLTKRIEELKLRCREQWKRGA